MPRSSSRLDSTMIGSAEPASRMRPDHLEPVDVGQAEIEHDEVGRVAGAPRPARSPPFSASIDRDSPAPPGWRAESAGSPARRRRRGLRGPATSVMRSCSVGRLGASAGDTGSVMVKTAPRPIGAVARRDACRPSPRRSRGRSRGPSPVPARRRSRLRDAVELVEDALEVGVAECPGPSSSTWTHRTAAVAAARVMAIERAGRRVLRRVVEQVEQHLLEQHGVERRASAGPAASVDLDAVVAPGSCWRAAARCRPRRRDRSAPRLRLRARRTRAASCRADCR